MALPNCGTDYAPGCGTQPQSLLEMLANCMINFTGCNIAGTPVTFLNVIAATDYCDDITSFWSCTNNDLLINYERSLVEHIFAVDDCGNLALKIFINLGAERQ